MSWSISYAWIQLLLEEDNSKYYDSEIRSDINDVEGNVDITVPNVKLGGEEQHIETNQSTQEVPRFCSLTPFQVTATARWKTS